MVLRFFLLAATFLLVFCSVPDRNNPDDRESIYYHGENSLSSSMPSSSSHVAQSSSSANIYSSSSKPSSSSSVAQSSSSADIYSSSSMPDSCPDAMTGYNTVTCGGKIYRTVKIGYQIWMAENLNYNASGSKCYENNDYNCNKYGRLYDWTTAKSVCPSGWHLPSYAEWQTLEVAVGGYAGTKLKSNSGCSSGSNGTDNYSFSALPGGAYSNYSILDNKNVPISFVNAGLSGSWWSLTDYSSSEAYFLDITCAKTAVAYYFKDKNHLFSVRCLQDY